MIQEAEFMAAFDAWTDRFAGYVGQKGKVDPGRYRAYGHEAPGHKWADAKLKWREFRMKMGAPPADSSPAAQEHLGLNRDATLSPQTGEGEKLRRR